MDNLNKQILTAVLNKVRSKELTTDEAKEILEMAGIVEMRKIYRKKSISSELMNKAGLKTIFIVAGE